MFHHQDMLFSFFLSNFTPVHDVVGWTFQGGNGATMGDRMYGTCVHLFVALIALLLDLSVTTCVCID